MLLMTRMKITFGVLFYTDLNFNHHIAAAANKTNNMIVAI